jgi:Domain of unknown function (DUF4365)
MGKRFSKQAAIGERGMAFIHLRVGEMGFIWHPRRVDHGIDGEIELVDPATGVTLNRILLVQSKASDRPFPGEDANRFHYLCDPRDVDYWMSGNAPVILVCSHPSDTAAWWVSIKDLFADAAKRRSRRVDFDKQRDRFDAAAAPQLLELASRSSTALYLNPPPRPERLLSNLLRIDATADTIWAAPAIPRVPRDAYARMNQRGSACSDWILSEGMLFSFRRPDEPPLDCLIDGDVEGHGTEEWAASKSPDVTRRFVRLLNQTLADLTGDSLRRHKKGYLYFRPSPDLTDYRVSTGRSRAGRTVFQVRPHSTEPDMIRWCRHLALEHQFVRFDREWFLELRPTYHFTSDGYRDLPWGPDLVKEMKRRERNAAVRSLVQFWGDFLRARQTLLDSPDTRLSFGELVTFDVDRGIDDRTWTPDIEEPEAQGDPAIPTLFDPS